MVSNSPFDMNSVTPRKPQSMFLATKTSLPKLSRNSSRMRYQGYIYSFSASRNKVAFWRCLRCQVSLKSDFTGEKVTVQQAKHDHVEVNYSRPDGRYEIPYSGSNNVSRNYSLRERSATIDRFQDEARKRPRLNDSTKDNDLSSSSSIEIISNPETDDSTENIANVTEMATDDIEMAAYGADNSTQISANETITSKSTETQNESQTDCNIERDARQPVRLPRLQETFGQKWQCPNINEFGLESSSSENSDITLNSEHTHSPEQESADMESQSLLNDSNASTAKSTLSHCNQGSLSILTADREGIVCRESSISADSDPGLIDGRGNLENISPTLKYAAGCIGSDPGNLENCASESVAEESPQTDNGANSEKTLHYEALNEQTFCDKGNMTMTQEVTQDSSQLQGSSQTQDQEQAQQLNEHSTGHSTDDCDLQIIDVKWGCQQLARRSSFHTPQFRGMVGASNVGRMLNSITNIPGLGRTQENIPVGHPALVVELPDGSRLNFMGSFMCVECREGITPCASCPKSTKCRICCKH